MDEKARVEEEENAPGRLSAQNLNRVRYGLRTKQKSRWGTATVRRGTMTRGSEMTYSMGRKEDAVMIPTPAMMSVMMVSMPQNRLKSRGSSSKTVVSLTSFSVADQV